VSTKAPLDARNNEIKFSPAELIDFLLKGGRYMATKIRPLHDRVIIRRLDEEEKTKGGLIIPDTAKEKPQEGTVIAVGPENRKMVR
jgi:hypothetical protein